MIREDRLFVSSAVVGGWGRCLERKWISRFVFWWMCSTLSQAATAQYALELTPVSGTMLAHSKFNQNLDGRRSTGLQASAMWLIPPDTAGRYLRFNKHRYVGFSLLGMEMGDGLLMGQNRRQELVPMGTGLAMMAISGARVTMPPILGFSSLQMQWGFGLLHLSKFYDSVENPNNLAMSSRFNFAAQLKIQAVRPISAHSSISLGAEMFHTSNSNWQKPNVGLNYAQFSLGYVYRLHAMKHLETDRCYWQGNSIKELSKSYQLSARFAYRKYRRDFPVYYPVFILEGSWGLPNAYSHRKSPIIRPDGTVLSYRNISGMPKGEWRFGVNVFHEGTGSALNSSAGVLQLESRWELGAFARRVMRFGPLDVFLDFGLYALGPQKDRIQDLEKARGFYNAIGTQYRINSQWMIIHRLKAHYHVADYMEFGVLYQW